MAVTPTPAADMQAMLVQMRALRDQMSPALGQVNKPEMDRAAPSKNELLPGAPTQPSFSSMVTDALQSVNQLQKTASNSANRFVAGEEDDLVKVMIEGQKSSVGFTALVQVRNRMVTAYQDIMNMPI